MKNLIHYTIAITTSVLVSACAGHHSTYQEQAKQTASLKMPSGVSLKTHEPYYPVPQHINTQVARPSLIPPNSGLAKQEKIITKTRS